MDTILLNLEKIFEWCIKEQFYFNQIEFFTGEIWGEEFGFKVFDILYKQILNGLLVNSIMIPSNCSFCLSEEKTQKIQYYIDKFNSIGIRIIFSVSVDGKIIEETSRPLNTGIIKDDTFYDRLITFAKHNTYYFHPMVAACNVDKWIENYKWWKNILQEYDYYSYDKIMMLEVRNNDWDQKAIDNYNSFINFLIEEFFNECNRDPYIFTKLYFNSEGQGLHGYIPYGLAISDNFAGCTVANSLTLRVGDLAICPCHRTAYNKLLYGFLSTDKDGNIVDLTANNPQMAVRILYSNNNLTSFKCDTCLFNSICLKGCFGSQMENTKDPFMPIESVCNFFEQKFTNIFNKLESLGIINECYKISPYQEEYDRVRTILYIYEGIKKRNGLGKYSLDDSGQYFNIIHKQ